MPTIVTYTYNCQACGQQVVVRHELRECLFCRAILCKACRKQGVCPLHQHVLDAREGSRLRQIDFWSRSPVWVGLSLLGVGLLVIGALSAQRVSRSTTVMSFWILLAASVVLPIVLAVVMHKARQRTRIRIAARLLRDFPDDPRVLGADAEELARAAASKGAGAV